MALVSCDIREKNQIELEDLPPEFKRDTKDMKATSKEGFIASSSDDIRKQLNPNNESVLTRDHRRQIKLAINMSNGNINSATKLLQKAGYVRGASRGRLRNILGLTITKNQADPELSEWFAQKYPNKTKFEDSLNPKFAAPTQHSGAKARKVVCVRPIPDGVWCLDWEK